MMKKHDTRGLLSQQHARSWEPVMARFAAAAKEVQTEGRPETLKRHQDRGQILARDRCMLLLDDNSPFLELCPFAGLGLETSTPCASLVAGIGSVSGRPTLIMSHVPTLSGGAWNELTVKKKHRIMEIGMENELPLISLVQSAGVFLPQQFQVFHSIGGLFRDLSLRSDRGQPSCAVVFGSSTAGGAYQPALSDYTIFVENQAQVFLGGPPLVKMATGEETDAETLGGASVHGQRTGLADCVAANEFEAILKAREWVATLKDCDLSPSTKPVSPPLSSTEDLLDIVNPDIRKPIDMPTIIDRLVDSSTLSEFKPKYGPNLGTYWALVFGFRVGIIANKSPVLNPQEASKGAQFIRLCNQQDTPIVFLHNVTGFMVGVKAEHGEIIKHGAKMVSAVSCSTVPHISIIIGASYGAGNYSFAGRSFKPRFLFTWPIGRCAVMGPEQLSGVMRIVSGAQADQDEVLLRERMIKEGECYSTSAALIDDGIIDPRDTRDVLGMCLEVVYRAGIKGSPSHSALARL